MAEAKSKLEWLRAPRQHKPLRQHLRRAGSRVRQDWGLFAMANVSAPFGFLQVGTASGAPNFARAGSPTPYKIKAGFSTAIYYGDAVRMWVSGDSGTGSAGYITPWVTGDGAGDPTKILVGIFTGCEYYSTSQRKSVWNNYYPGSDATGDVTAYVVDDPNSQWMVQASSGPITAASIGAGADVAATPVPNTTLGTSGMVLGTPTTTVTLPFKVVNLVTSPPGVNGRDVATAYNLVVVSFNNQIYKALLGV